jgi:hypothetical protein
VVKLECARESNPTLCVQKQTAVTVEASQQASEAKVLAKAKIRVNAQNAQSEARVMIGEVAVQVVHETTAKVEMIAMIAASVPRAQIELPGQSGPLAKIYHQ